MAECIKCGKPIRNNRSICTYCDGYMCGLDKGRADERERCAELLVNKYHSDSFYKESYKKDYLLLFNEKEQQ